MRRWLLIGGAIVALLCVAFAFVVLDGTFSLLTVRNRSSHELQVSVNLENSVRAWAIGERRIPAGGTAMIPFRRGPDASFAIDCRDVAVNSASQMEVGYVTSGSLIIFEIELDGCSSRVLSYDETWLP
jgi:hypothetical protein